jgi:phosphomannomutase
LPPFIAIGFDERAASPDLIRGVALSLRRTGCQVVDMGMTTKPRLWFGVDQLKCTAAVFVTGTGAPPSWTGLDFFVQGRGPLSRTQTEVGLAMGSPDSQDPSNSVSTTLSLNQLEQRLHFQHGRFTRQSGQQRVFDPSDSYEVGLRKHFHALRPLHVCVGTPSQLVSSVLRRLFERLPCKIHLVDLPVRARDTPDATAGDIRRISRRIVDRAAHLGLVIDDDGQRCWFLDENGRLLPSSAVFSLVAKHVWQDDARYPIVLQGEAPPELERSFQRQGVACVRAENTQADLVSQMRRHQAVVGGMFQDRYWFRDAFPTCDAVLTLAHILSALSRSDARFSERIAACN